LTYNVSSSPASQPLITVDELPENIRRQFELSAQPLAVRKKINLEEELRQKEKELILEAIAASYNNKAKAAKMLGLTRPKLYRRMELLGIADK